MIYFLRAGEDGPVKVGWSKDHATLARRISSLQTGQAYKMTPLRTLHADRWVEAWLHDFFSEFRLTGEWFRFHPHMLTIVAPIQRPEPIRKVKVKTPGPRKNSGMDTDAWGARIREGQQHAVRAGKTLGRPRGASDESIAAQLALKWGVGRISRPLHVSIQTVMRVRDRLAAGEGK